MGGVDKARAAMAKASPEDRQQMISDLTQKAQESAAASSKDRGYGPEHLQPVGEGQIGGAQVKLAKAPDGSIHALPHVNPFDPNSQKSYFEEMANHNFQTTASTKLAQQQMRNQMWEDRSDKTLKGVEYKADVGADTADKNRAAKAKSGVISKTDAELMKSLPKFAKPDPLTGRVSTSGLALLRSSIAAIKDPDAKAQAAKQYEPLLGGGPQKSPMSPNVPPAPGAQWKVPKNGSPGWFTPANGGWQRVGG
jgi:hypothetical protein